MVSFLFLIIDAVIALVFMRSVWEDTRSDSSRASCVSHQITSTIAFVSATLKIMHGDDRDFIGKFIEGGSI